MRFHTLLVPALLAGFAASAAHAELVVSSGYAVTPLSVAPGTATTGALDALPSGNLVLFDGTSVVEVEPQTGGLVRTLFTPGASVFASFLAADPTGTYVLFGESSNHEIWRVPLSGAAASVVATLPWNYACTFRGAGRAVIAHGDTSFQYTNLVELEVDVGTVDLLARISGPSGPVAFDGEGNLYYGSNSPTYPAPAGQQSVLWFAAAQVDGAVGATHLSENDAQLFATGLTAPASFAFDEEGDLLVADSIESKVVEYDPSGVEKGTVGVESNGVSPSVGALAFVGNGADATQFAPFQPEAGGALFALSTDFATFNHVNRVTPRRPLATASPVGPIAAGPFSFHVDHGPAGSFGLLFVATTAAATELAVTHDATTFLIGFDPASLFGTTPVFLDAAGALAIQATHPGGAFDLTVQVALWDVQSGPVGTSTPLPLAFQ